MSLSYHILFDSSSYSFSEFLYCFMGSVVYRLELHLGARVGPTYLVGDLV